MEIDRVSESSTSDQPVPALIEFIAAKNVDGFDSAAPFRPSRFRPLEVETETPPMNHQREHSVSISMPSSPFMSNTGLFSEETGKVSENGILVTPHEGNEPKQVKFHSQPMLKGAHPAVRSASANVNPSVRRLSKDTRFNSFKTWSGKLEHQFTTLRGKGQGHGSEESNAINPGNEPMPCVERYFAALEGPELETLRPSETSILPEDKKWPFLLRYPVSTFGIILGVSSQAMLYKALATTSSMQFLHISLDVNLVLWLIAITLMVIVSSIYLLKVIVYFEAVRREYYHPIRVNFFFAPWIALLFLALGVPPSVTTSLPHWLWYVLMTPIFCLELKIYGQWMSGGQRRLSRVANPSNHLSVVGNFVGALLGASMGLKEGPLFFFAVGLAHYTVLFVTLYQRLPTNETLPKELHPVFFLFVAAPSVASVAWAKLNNSFDYGSRIAYFITMFLYLSLAVRVNFFRGFQFSLAWWAYTFPMTGAAIATIRYSLEVTNTVTRTLAVALSVICTLIVSALLVSTILHAFVFRDLFPNDIAIAISDKKPHKPNHRRWFHGSEDHSNDIENYLKFSDSNPKDLETATGD